MSEKSEKLAVFGATGFVGSTFCKTTKIPLEIVPRDERSFTSQDVVYFISTTHNYHVFDEPLKDIDTNLRVLLEALQSFKDKKGVFNFVSSWFVYGDTQLPATETSACEPKGFYSITKRAAEQLLISFCGTFGLKYRILRLCNVYGTGDSGISKQKNALQYLVGQIKANEPINLYHDGYFYRDYMHVDDVAQAIELVIEKGEINQVYNIGSGKKLCFRELIDFAMKQTGSKSKINAVEPADFHKLVQVKDFFMDVSKLEELGFNQRRDIWQGMKELCQ